MTDKDQERKEQAKEFYADEVEQDGAFEPGMLDQLHPKFLVELREIAKEEAAYHQRAGNGLAIGGIASLGGAIALFLTNKSDIASLAVGIGVGATIASSGSYEERDTHKNYAELIDKKLNAMKEAGDFVEKKPSTILPSISTTPKLIG